MPKGNTNKPIKAEPLKETLRGDWEYKTILSKKDAIDEIMKMRVEYGWTRMHIREHLTKEWKLTDSQADDYMKIAAAEFDRLAVQEFSKDLREDVERFESLYIRCSVSSVSDTSLVEALETFLPKRLLFAPVKMSFVFS